MNTQSWTIKSWPMLEWYLPPDAKDPPAFKHLATEVRNEDSETGLRSGETVWVADGISRCAGLAWEWLEIKRDVVMLTDPNSVITNLRMVDAYGKTIYGPAKTTLLNRIIHALPWQQAVCAWVQRGATPAVSKPAVGKLPLEVASARVDMPTSQAGSRADTRHGAHRVHPLRRSNDPPPSEDAHRGLPAAGVQLRRAA